MGRSRSSRRAMPPPSASRTRNMLKRVKNFRKPTNCHRALVAIRSLANLDGASFYIHEDDMKAKVNSHATRCNEVLGKQTNRLLDHALLKCRKLGLIKYEPGGDSFKLTALGKELLRQVNEAVRDLEFATDKDIHHATCEAVCRLLPDGCVPTVKEIDVENRGLLETIDELKARCGELSSEGVPVDSDVSREADEGVLPDNTPSTPIRPRPSQNLLTGYPTPESIPRHSLSMRYAEPVTPVLTSTATQNDDDTMIVDEPRGPTNNELDQDERIHELNLKNRELEKDRLSLAAEFSCVVRKYRMKEKEIQALLEEKDKEIQALKVTIQAEQKNFKWLNFFHRHLRGVTNRLQSQVDDKTAFIRKLEQDLKAANDSILALNDAHFQEIFPA